MADVTSPPSAPIRIQKSPEQLAADTKMRDIYSNFLAEQGYRPKTDADGDVQFMKEGKTYYIIIDGRDPQFFRISFPNFWPLDNDAEQSRAFDAINQANRFTKVAKFVVGGNKNVSASAELLLPSPDSFKVLFDRAMGIIAYGFNVFVERMKATAPLPAAVPAPTGNGDTPPGGMVV